MTTPHQDKASEIKLDQELINNSKVHKNVGQEFVVTTVDKVKLCLREHKEVLNSRLEWAAPLGVFLALLITLVAADFKDAFGLKKEDWRAVFIVGTIASAIWLIRCIYRVYKFWNKANEDNFIQALKNNSEGANKTEKRAFKFNVPVFLVFIVLIGPIVWLAVPNFLHPVVGDAAHPPCIIYLRELNEAKQQWALDHGKTNGVAIIESDLTPYIRLDVRGNFPKCPQGGVYTIGKVGEKPTCSLGTNVTPAHVLP